MMNAQEIIDWAKTLPPDAGVYIQDNGLTLAVVNDPEPYLDVGGHTPEDEEKD